MTTPDWRLARQQMLLDPTIINLNTGSFGPVPRAIFDRVTELRRQLAAEPTDFYVRWVPPLLWKARCRLAEFLNVPPHRLIFRANVSSAINVVASSLRLNRPGEILLSDHEYGAMHWCWERAAQRGGLTLKTFPLDTLAESPDAILNAFEAAISHRTRLAFFSHVLSPTGLVLPVKEMVAIAKRRGVLTVIDGAHAPGMLPLDISDIGADFYGANCHKWMLAPSGSGFLAIGPGMEDRLEPLEVSWGYHYPRTDLDAPDEFGSTRRIRALEFEGTREVNPWLVTPEVIDFQSMLGWQAIRQRMHELSQISREMLVPLGLPEATPRNPAMHGALTAFRIPDATDPVKLRTAIWKHRIEIPVIERPDRRMIRVSGHFYTLPEEIQKLAEILPAAIREATP
ncbi:aminotransferase class V-fold PLP-dependent enzyme [Tuwongella immobilis]|nr:aminotransferase class V-fold PLP-dependent enzyme [Tuwongella immobilis]